MQQIKTSGVSQNTSWTLHKGSSVIQIMVTISTLLFYAVFFDINTGIQLTVITYNMVTFFFFHWIVGDPFDHRYKGCTFWEQMCEQFSDYRSIIFMTLYPCLLFILCSRIIEWNEPLFYLCVFSFCLVIIPKFRFMHMRRIFGIRAEK